MDILDKVAERATIDPEIIYQIRREEGGRAHYIHSARPETHRRIQQATAQTITQLAKRFHVHRNTVRRIQS